MRRVPFLLLVGFMLATLPCWAGGGETGASRGDGASSADKGAATRAKSVSVPLFFEANQGQTDPQVRFLTRSSGYTLFVTPTETVLAAGETHVAAGKKSKGLFPDLKSDSQAVLRMQFIGANPSSVVTGLLEQPGKVNYLIGNDPGNWHRDVPIYSQVRSQEIYPGIDLLFHGDDHQLEYDFIVAPGSDPDQVAFRISGARKIEIDSRGDLVLHASSSVFRMHRPVIYQTFGSDRRQVEGNFILKGKRDVGFRLAAYDRSRPLVIDPAIGYATFLGGSNEDLPTGLAVDTAVPASPKTYVAGATASTFASFPEASNIGLTHAGAQVYTFIAKIDTTTTGTASLNYLTFIGGSTPYIPGNFCQNFPAQILLDTSHALAASNIPVIAELTDCSDFPGVTQISNFASAAIGTTAGAVFRLNAAGNAILSGGLLRGNGKETGAFMFVDASGNIIYTAATGATNLIATPGAYMTQFDNGATSNFQDCYVVKLDTTLAIKYLTYLNVGGSSTSDDTIGCGAVENSSGKIFAGGSTFSSTAFAAPNGFQPTFQGFEDTFAMALDPSLTGANQLYYSSYYGGGGATEPQTGAIQLGSGSVVIAGQTTSSSQVGDIPLRNAFQTANLAAAVGGETGYFLIIDTTTTGSASLALSSYFGGSSGNDAVYSLAYDAIPGSTTTSRLVIGGQTSSPNLPMTVPNSSLQPFVGGQDGFISVLNVPNTSAGPAATLVYSTFIGGGVVASGQSERVVGVATDANHTIYATARTPSSTFFGNTVPSTTVNGFQTSCVSCASSLGDLAIFTIGTSTTATLQSIAVTPATATTPVSQTQQFTATGHFSDGSIQDLTATVTWTSSNTSIATINTSGLATGVIAGGPVTITAKQGAISNTASLTITGGTGACSGSINWTGAAGDTLWTTPANWDKNALPISTDNVCIGTTFAGNTINITSIALSTNQTIASLITNANIGFLTGPLAITGSAQFVNNLTISGGT
ncbi:MAG: Ig-like domain-containing protein, partial [Candidatus Acidiferrales bacterium]